MQRIYLSRILEKPRQLEVNGQERMVRALQMPHRFQRLKGSALETIEIDPAAIENLFLSQKKLGPITLDGITLLPLRWEKHEETEEYTLVLDEAFFFPTCNLRNSVLDRAGLKALQMAEGTREEAAREALITLMLAGEGHYERLIKLENQDEFEFVIDKLDRFYPFPSEIQDNTIREFVEIAILSTFNQFFLGPSSTSGKYHPADEVTLGGLLHHCKRVAQLALKFCDRLGIEGITRDVIIAAALLHDICKSVEINEAGEFKWGYHSVEDHSVIAELWLAKILEDNFPHWSRRQKAKIKRILQSVRYHQNIWVDNYDTALTEQNPLSDWMVACADIISGLPNVRVHYRFEPDRSPEETLNDLLNHSPDFQSEHIQETDSAKLRKSIFLAEKLFPQFEITDKETKEKIIASIRKGEIFPAENLALNKSELIITLAQMVPEIEGVEIWLPEDIYQEAQESKKEPLEWRTTKVSEEAQSLGETLPKLLQSKGYPKEFLEPQRDELLKKINHRVSGVNQVPPEKFSLELLMGLMQELGTADINQIYQIIYGNCDSPARKKIRAILQAPSQVEETIQKLRGIAEDAAYSGQAIGKVEKRLRPKLNEALEGMEIAFTELDPHIIALLEEEHADLAPEIISEMEAADEQKLARYSPRRVLRRIESRLGIAFSKKTREVLRHELEYRQRNPFNRMNREVLGWLMQRYRTTDGVELYQKFYASASAAERETLVSVLRECEAQTRKLEAKHRGSVPIAEKRKVLKFAQDELQKILPPPEKKAFLPPPVGAIPELKSLAQFLINYGLKSMRGIRDYLNFARIPKNYEDFDYFDYGHRQDNIPGISAGVEIASDKLDRIDQGERIMIYGDYDADGITGTTILVESLREIAVAKLMAKGYSLAEAQEKAEENIQLYIPDRKQGFGLNQQSLDEIISKGFKTIITTDNGGNNLAEIKYVKDKHPDVKIIVTDHHTLSDELPPADAIIHTKLLPHTHQAHHLSGAGVAYKFARALYQEAGLDIGDKYLEYVAISIITDVVPVTKKSENRALLYFGFQKFNKLFETLYALEKEKKETEVNEVGDAIEPTQTPAERTASLYDEKEFQESGLGIGLYLLAKNLRIYGLDRDRIGFGLGPVLNAIGRLAEAQPAVELFLTRDPQKALQILEKLVRYNERRKDIQTKITEEALEILEKMTEDKEFDPGKDLSVVLTSENWHAGVVGIVAARISEEIQGMAAVGGKRKGSIRSIPGLHIMAVLRKAVELYQEDGHRGSFFEKYGGHAGAAGYTLKPDKLEEFKIYARRAAHEVANTDSVFREMYTCEKPKKRIMIDAELPASMISASFYNLIKLLGPFGRESYGRTQEVARPVWSTKALKVVGWKVMGGQKDHLKITFEDETGRQFSGNYFRQNKVETKAMFYRTDSKQEVFVDAAYRLDVDYKGNPELLILDLKEAN